ncbi:MAG: hypothetical protein QOE36_3571, partial [Gaiellaceae bacterium]|nr:hypothetical protein [Gaiellaceae bacterium]
MAVCGECSAPVPDGARFCPACGARVGAGAGTSRKTVTAVFLDVVAWTPLAEKLDPEALRRFQSEFFAAVRASFERHGGTVEKYIGDAVLGVFGIPAVHEDDALRALRAAQEAIDAVGELASGLAARAGVESGEVAAGESADGQHLVTGDAVNVAARLQPVAGPGEIVLGTGTERLTRGLVTLETLDALELKGKSAPVAAWKLVALEPPAGSASPDLPLVGRERERIMLGYALDQAVAGATSHLFTLLGAAGVGKSRLVTEFCRDLEGRATLLRGHCLPYGEGITFWPLRKAVEDAAGITDKLSADEAVERIRVLAQASGEADAVAARIAGAIGLTETPSAPEETFWAARRFFEALAREQPLVVVLEDLHWGEPTFLDLVEHVADWSRGYPMLLLCVARPELVDTRPGWGGGKLNATSMLLEPLDDSAC